MKTTDGATAFALALGAWSVYSFVRSNGGDGMINWNKYGNSAEISALLKSRVDALTARLAPEGYTFIFNRAVVHVAPGNAGYDSQHNADKWGVSRAVDIGILHNGNKLTPAELRALFDRVRGMRLFSGIGIYPRWNTPGMHLDVRTGRNATDPAQWSDIGVGSAHVYASVDAAVNV